MMHILHIKGSEDGFLFYGKIVDYEFGVVILINFDLTSITEFNTLSKVYVATYYIVLYL